MGHERLQVDPAALDHVHQPAHPLLAARAERGHDLVVAEPNGTVIRSDQNLLAEIIQNLVSNAIRYTESGRVALTLRSDGDRLHIDVEDTGIGIPAGQVDEIFREFHQLRNPGRNPEGFGLGLAIVRRLADLLGHEITVRSEEGRGSRFTVTVPVVAQSPDLAAAESLRRESSRSDGSGTILLAEDDRSVADAWSLLLRAEGYRVVVADSAAAALAAARGLDVPPVLMISDYHLQDGSTGVEAVDVVRAYFGADLPAFIVSGDTSKVVDDARRLPNSRVMSKPVHSDELLSLAEDAARSGTVPNA